MKRLRPYLWRILAAVAVAGLLPVIALVVAPNSHNSASGSVGTSSQQLLAKAQPDECFNGVGNPYPTMSSDGTCPEGQSKVNQGYVWDLAKAGNTLWFGTGANPNCLVAGFTLGLPTPELTDDFVCEFGESQSAQSGAVPPQLGDQRTPNIFTYDLSADKLTDRTSEVLNASSDDATLLSQTIGLRSGGTLNGVDFMAGPDLAGGISMFAFDTDTGAYLGSHEFSAYSDIRHFVTVDGVLYAGVGTSDGTADGKTMGGKLLRWDGDKSNPFQFDEVATLPDQIAELTTYDNRLAVSTWPSSPPAGSTSNTHYAGVWLSPTLPDGGLTTGDVNTPWTEIWKATDYEPDPVIAHTYGAGALATYHGQLYWGTMNVPFKSTVTITHYYPPANDQQKEADLYMSQRTIAIFRGTNLDTDSPKTEMLYGKSKLPVYDPNKQTDNGTGGWTREPTGFTPVYGSAGFGNFWNNYTWTMGVANGKLYVGTMDWSLLAKDLMNEEAQAMHLNLKNVSKKALHQLSPSSVKNNQEGADLWAFSSPNTPAKAVSDDGLGNYTNYGIRTMVIDGNTLYLGTANPMNLDTSTTDSKPEGGWELIKYNTSRF